VKSFDVRYGKVLLPKASFGKIK